MSSYKEVKKATKGLHKEKGSRFISYIFPVYNEDQIKHHISNIKNIENSANHHCYGYVLNYDKSIYKFSDDGEPSSTAGKPILGQIRSYDLTNTLIIVVRYFGGKKLGASGLIRSYKMAANDAIQNTLIITKAIKDYYEAKFNYNDINIIMSLIKKYQLEILNTNFNTFSTIIFAVPIDNNEIINHFDNIRNCNIKYLKTE